MDSLHSSGIELAGGDARRQINLALVATRQGNVETAQIAIAAAKEELFTMETILASA